MSVKKTLVLHVGTDKTGTSALQQLFSRNAASLKQAGVYYPVAGRGTQHQHHLLFAPICRYSEKAGFRTDISWPEALGALEAELGDRPETRVLLSSELLAQGVDFPALADLKKMFAGTRVILYLRRQDHYVSSRYEQAVKTLGMCEPFSLERALIPDYWELAQAWEEFAGSRQGLIVRPYEKESFHGGSIYADFLHHALEMPLGDGFVLPDNRDTNPPLHPDAVEFLRRANWHRQPRGAISLLWHLTGYSLRETPSELAPFARNNQIPPSDRAAILDRCRAQNARVAERYLGSKDGALFSPYKPRRSKSRAFKPRLTQESCLDIAHYVVTSLAEIPTTSPVNVFQDLQLIKEVVEEVRRDHADDESWREPLADFRAFCNQKELSLVERNLTDLGDALAAKDKYIAQKDRVIASLQNATKETASFLQQKDDFIAQQQDALAAQAAGLQDKDDYIAQQQEALAAQAAGLQDKDDYIDQQQKVLAAQAAALQQKDDYIAQQQGALAKQLADLQQKVDHIARQQDALQQKDDYIAQQQEALAAQSEGIRQKDDYIAQQQEALAAQSEGLQQKDDYIAQQQDALAAQLADLQRKDASIDEQQKTLDIQSERLGNLLERVSKLEAYIAALHGTVGWRVISPFLKLPEINEKKEP